MSGGKILMMIRQNEPMDDSSHKTGPLKTGSLKTGPHETGAMSDDRRDDASGRPQLPDDNPFKDMGFIQFWVVSTCFYMTFPLSLAISYLLLGKLRTKQLVAALVHDFLQTLLIVIAIIAVIIWAIYQFVAGLF